MVSRGPVKGVERFEQVGRVSMGQRKRIGDWAQVVLGLVAEWLFFGAQD
jgi:hypothetical protein